MPRPSAAGEQVMHEWLGQVWWAAERVLDQDDRRSLVHALQRRIEDESGLPPEASAAQVRAVLTRLGPPSSFVTGLRAPSGGRPLRRPAPPAHPVERPSGAHLVPAPGRPARSGAAQPGHVWAAQGREVAARIARLRHLDADTVRGATRAHLGAGLHLELLVLLVLAVGGLSLPLVGLVAGALLALAAGHEARDVVVACVAVPLTGVVLADLGLWPQHPSVGAAVGTLVDGLWAGLRWGAVAGALWLWVRHGLRSRAGGRSR